MESVRRSRVRVGPQRLVEPRAYAKRHPYGGARGRGGVRLPAVGHGRALDRLLGRWAHRVSLRPRWGHAHGDRGSRDGGTRRRGPTVERLAMGTRHPGRGLDHRAHGRVGDRTGSGDLAGLRRALDRGPAAEPARSDRAGLPVGPGSDRVSDRRRVTRARVLLPTDQSGCGRTREIARR